MRPDANRSELDLLTTTERTHATYALIQRGVAREVARRLIAFQDHAVAIRVHTDARVIGVECGQRDITPEPTADDKALARNEERANGVSSFLEEESPDHGGTCRSRVVTARVAHEDIRKRTAPAPRTDAWCRAVHGLSNPMEEPAMGQLVMLE